MTDIPWRHHQHKGKERLNECCYLFCHFFPALYSLEMKTKKGLCKARAIYLSRSGMRKHHNSIGISDAVYVWQSKSLVIQNLHLVVDWNKSSSIGSHSNILQSQSISVRFSSSGN